MGSIYPTNNLFSLGLGGNSSLKKLNKSMQRLSSGKKYPSAEQGAGSINYAQRLRTQVMRSKSIQTTIKNAVGYTQTQDDALKLAEDALQRMHKLAVAATDPLKSDEDRAVIDQEVQKIEAEIEVLQDKKYNGKELFSSDNINYTPDTSLITYTQLEVIYHEEDDHDHDHAHGVYWDPAGELNLEYVETVVQQPVSYTLGTGEGWIEAGAPYVDPNVSITYSFHSSLEGDPLTGISTADSKAAIVEALALWANAADGNITFTEVADSGPAPSDASNYDPTGHPVMRFGAHYIDGDGAGVLAHAYYPTANSGLAGDTHYDTGQTWDVSLFLETSVHEIGHALGLGHTSNPGIMEPIIQNRYSGLGSAYLLQDDIDGIRALYAGGEVLPENSDSIYTLEATSFDSFDVSGVTTTTISNAQTALNSLENLHTSLQGMRVIVGSNMRSLNQLLEVHSKQGFGLKEAQSAVEDIDIAETVSDFTVNQMLVDAKQAISVQAMRFNTEIISSLIS
ncbi:MAG: matrixin family metalloprotease [Chlamydiales bacterium]|nr:matrixin family metalloprotease [Chlamydiales bacterium]NCF70430.1 matrixin family metalloprotease [Chlamydiales bacterium]